jgi:2-polyprenyl-3-methyl-5-hydroxy-6-metoxy-1,4-benzoquinol methylase
MKFTDEIWENYWSKELYAPIVEDYKGIIVGTDMEPRASLIIASFINALGEKYREGMKLLDFGCGGARVCNFLSKRLKDFQYIGLERKESQWGQDCINEAQTLFGHDPRVDVGYVNTDLEKRAIETSDAVLLLSVFTHTTIETTEDIVKKLLPIIDRGGCMVFSMILADEYKLVIENAYGFKDNYNITYNTRSQVDYLREELGVSIDLIDTFDAGVIHSIYRLKR